MKCQLCVHYHYQPGMVMSIPTRAGMTRMSTNPRCNCDYAQIGWDRTGAEVRKPREIPCDYQPREMTCLYCKKKFNGAAISRVISREDCVCKKCSEIFARKLEQEAQANETRC